MKQNATSKGHPLRRWLKRNGLRQGDLANVAGVTGSLISALITGQAAVSLEVAIRLSLATGLPVDAFVRKSASKTLKLYVERQNTHSDLSKEEASVA